LNLLSIKNNFLLFAGIYWKKKKKKKWKKS
jgi:hypothetical protein